MNCINFVLAVVAFIADSCMHGVLYTSIHICMPYGIHTVTICKYIIYTDISYLANYRPIVYRLYQKYINCIGLIDNKAVYAKS